jgi:hypothetical protein
MAIEQSLISILQKENPEKGPENGHATLDPKRNLEEQLLLEWQFHRWNGRAHAAFIGAVGQMVLLILFAVLVQGQALVWEQDSQNMRVWVSPSLMVFALLVGLAIVSFVCWWKSSLATMGAFSQLLNHLVKDTKTWNIPSLSLIHEIWVIRVCFFLSVQIVLLTGSLVLGIWP